MRHTILLAAALLLAGCTGPTSSVRDAAPPTADNSDPAAGDDTQSTPAAPAVAEVGQTVEFDDGYGSAGTITLHSVRRVPPAADSPFEPPQHGSYVVIDVTVTAVSGDVSANPFGFRAQSPDGHTYDYSDGADASIEHPIDSSPIAPGRQVRGEIGFDAPPGELLIDFSTGLATVATFRVTS